MIKNKFPIWLNFRNSWIQNGATLRQSSRIASNSDQPLEGTQLSENRQTDVSKISRLLYNTPFLKNVFAGNYSPESLIYPECLSKSELRQLDNLVLKAKDIFTKKDEKLSVKDPLILMKLKQSGLVGSLVSEDYGGANLKATQVLRLFEEMSDESIGLLLYAHNNYGITCIDRYGTTEQKEKYLPNLSSGNDGVALCINEDLSGSDLSLIKTKAILSSDGSCYVLNGEKSWVVNANNAKIFIVFAKTKVKTGQEVEDKLTAFIIDQPDETIKFGPHYQTLSHPDLPVSSITFKDTKIPSANVVGELGCGYQMAVDILNGDTFFRGGLWCGILKSLSKQLIDHCIKRKLFGKSLKDFGLIQEKLADIGMMIYAIESMSYMIAGIVDSYEHPDITCESAALKIYASEKLWWCVKETMQVTGSTACKLESDLPKLLMNAATYSMTQSTNEILKLYLTLSCLQYAGTKHENSIRKKRDSFNNVGFLFKESWRQLKDRKGSDLKLYDYVHPELSFCGESLGPQIQRLKDVIIKYWSSDFTKNLQENQFALNKFAKVGINVFVINCVLARATRSKAIGLKNCDLEIDLAQTICGKLLKEIDDTLNDLELGEQGNGDSYKKKIAEAIIKGGGYCVEHPLTKNW